MMESATARGSRIMFHRPSNGRYYTLTLRGIPALLFIVAIFALPHLLLPSMPVSEAETNIREFIQLERSNAHLRELEALGDNVPDVAMATRWEKELRQDANIVFSSVEVKRAFFMPPLRRRTCYAVKATLNRDGATQVEFYWIRGRDFSRVRRTSETWWRFPI